jgi:hypothetical protein
MQNGPEPVWTRWPREKPLSLPRNDSDDDDDADDEDVDDDDDDDDDELSVILRGIVVSCVSSILLNVFTVNQVTP